MKAYNFILDITKLKDESTQSIFDKEFKKVLGNNLDDFIGYTEAEDENKMIMYFYTHEESTLKDLLDILLDYRMIIEMKDITEELKLDYTKFKDIDNFILPNFDLLDKFIQYHYDDDFIIEYIANNGVDRYKTEIKEKFFPRR
jgi:hypothetical protein